MFISSLSFSISMVKVDSFSEDLFSADPQEDTTTRFVLFVSFIISFMAVISAFFIHHYVFSSGATQGSAVESSLFSLVNENEDFPVGTSCTYPGMAIIFQNILICFR